MQFHTTSTQTGPRLDLYSQKILLAATAVAQRHADLILAEAQALCPPPTTVPRETPTGDATGELKASLGMTVIPAAQAASVIILVGTSSDIGLFVEFGTGRKAEPSEAGELSHRADWAGMAPQPFLGPARAKAALTYVSSMRTAITSVLQG